MKQLTIVASCLRLDCHLLISSVLLVLSQIGFLWITGVVQGINPRHFLAVRKLMTFYSDEYTLNVLFEISYKVKLVIK